MSGEAVRRRNQRKGAPPKLSPKESEYTPSFGTPGKSSGSGCCVKLLFFVLLCTATIITVAIYTDYQTGQLREAYEESIPKEYRLTLEDGLLRLHKQYDWALQESSSKLNDAGTFVRSHLKEIKCGEKNCDDFLFGPKDDEPSITSSQAAKVKAEKEATLKAQKEKAEKEAKLKAEKEAMLKAEKEAKLKAEAEAKLKAEQEAKLKAEKEAKLKAEQEAKLKAEKEAKQKAEQEAKLKAEKEAKLKAEKEAKLKAEQEAKLKAEKEAKMKAEQEAKLKAEKEAKQKAEQEAKLKAEKEAKMKVEQEAKLKAEKEAKQKVEQEAKLKAEKEAKQKAEQEAKLKAEKEAKMKAEQEAKLKAEKEAKMKAEQEAKLKAEKEAKQKAEQEAKLKAEQEAKLRAEEVAKLKAEHEVKAEREAKLKAEKEAQMKVKAPKSEKKAQKSSGKKSGSLDDPSEIRSKIHSSDDGELERKRKLEQERLMKEDLSNNKDSKSEKDRNEALDAAKKAAKLSNEQAPPHRPFFNLLVCVVARKELSKRLITNAEDARIEDELDSADSLLDHDPQGALLRFEKILEDSPGVSSPRAVYGKALALKKLAEVHKSNPKLEAAISELQSLLAMGDLVPDALYILGGEEAVRLLKFRGWNGKAVSVMKLLTSRFPDNMSLFKELGVLHLIMGQNEAAMKVFEGVLETDSEDGFALAHLGFVHKIISKSNEEMEIAVSFLKRGITSRAEGVLEGNFFFHLGDALSRLGRKDEADLVYQDGADLGIFKSFWQRSLYNLPDLKSKPIWTPEETKSGEELEKIRSQWEKIRDEIIKVRQESAGFLHETENLLDSGLWKQFEIYRQGLKVKSNCLRTPFTCSLFEHFPPARTNSRGQIKFSVMSDKTHVHAHSGPTNTRLRVHLPLIVPPRANSSNLRLRVTDRFLTWKEGELLIFDDSFDHEVWNNSGGERLILIFDIWHPDITPQLAATLPPI